LGLDAELLVLGLQLLFARFQLSGRQLRIVLQSIELRAQVTGFGGHAQAVRTEAINGGGGAYILALAHTTACKQDDGSEGREGEKGYTHALAQAKAVPDRQGVDRRHTQSSRRGFPLDEPS